MNLPTTSQSVVFTSSIYKLLGYSEHRSLKRVVNNNIELFNEFGEVRVSDSQPGALGGRPSEEYCLNLNHLLLLTGISKNSKNSKKIEILPKVIDAYANASALAVFNMIQQMDLDEVQEDKFVYVAKESCSGRYKIGISSNPEARVKALNTGNPEKLVLIHAYLATDSGYKSESLAHAIYEKERLHGEWFSSGIDLNKLPSYSVKCNIDAGYCECKNCSEYDEVSNCLMDKSVSSRDEAISIAIKSCHITFENAAKHVDSLIELGVMEIN